MKLHPLLRMALGVILCAFTLLSCKKSDPSVDEEGYGDYIVSVSESYVLPGHIVELTTSFPLTRESYNLRIGTETMQAVRTSSRTLAYMIPYVASGEYLIEMSTLSPNLGQIMLDVLPYAPITDIAQSSQEVIAWMDMETAVPDDPTLDNLMKTRFEEELNKLSDSEKKVQLLLIKNFLQQIAKATPELNNKRMASSPYVQNAVLHQAGLAMEPLSAVSKSSTVDPNTIRYHAARFTAAMVGGALVVGGAVAVIWGSGPLAVITLPAYAIIASAALKKMARIIKESVVEIWGIAAVAVSDAVVIPRSSLSAKARAVASNNIMVTNSADGLAFMKGAPLEVDISFHYGSIALALEPHVETDFFTRLFSAYHTLIELYTPLYQGQQKLQELLGTNKEVLSPPSEFMPSEFVTDTRPVNAQHIKIENISPAGLSISSKQGANGIVFTADRGTITDKVNIKFDVVYKQAAFGTTVIRTYSGTYEGSERNEEPGDDPLIGKWLVVAESVGAEFYDWPNDCPTKKDHVEFTKEGIYNHFRYNSLCQEDTYSRTYQIDENTLTLREGETGESVRHVMSYASDGALILTVVGHYALKFRKM